MLPDKNFEYGLRGLLSRPTRLGFRGIQYTITVHPKRDPGCARSAHEILRPFCRDHDRALLMFDKEGCGYEQLSTNELVTRIRSTLAANGWGNRAEVVVLEPELEAWAFAPSSRVEDCLGWNRQQRLRAWLEGQGLWRPGESKPTRPKEALESALFVERRPRSSSIYECLGRSVSTSGCTDRAFQSFLQTLVNWFPPEN